MMYYTALATGRRPALRRPLLALVGFLGMGLLAVALSGCDVTTEGAGGPPKDCGTVNTRGPQVTNGAGVEDCFYQGYTQCQAVSMTYTQMGVDAGATRTFATKSQGNACVVTDTVQTYVIPTNSNHSATYTCSGVKQQDGGLLFTACGQDGDVAVPGPSGNAQ
jgi:hypothetical protein